MEHEETLSDWEIRRMRQGSPARLFVFDVRDDADYGDPTRRIVVIASSFEAAEALWTCPFTEDNVFARPVFLKGRHLRLPGPARILHTRDLEPTSYSSEAA
jgi:hypothetical protein